MNSSMPASWYSAMRSATSSWLPTSAVPAPPRTSPTPAPPRGRGAAGDGRIARPRVGGDDDPVAPSAVELEHPALALGLRRAQVRLRGGDRRRVHRVEQPPRLAPRLLGRVARDHVQADAVAQLAALPLGELANAA